MAARLSTMATTLALAVGLVVCAGIGSARADGSFVQLEFGRSDYSLTALLRRGPLGLTFGWSDWSTGNAASVWGNFGVPLGNAVWLRSGPSLRRDDSGQTDMGLKFGLERFAATDSASLFLLAERTTINGEYLALAQVGHPASRTSIGIVFQGDRGDFRERSVAFGYQLRTHPVTVRIGYRMRARALFAGISFSTF